MTLSPLQLVVNWQVFAICLLSRTSCCISQWPSQWEMTNSNPQLRNRLIDLFDEIWNLELLPEDHPPCKISFWSDDVGGLGEYPVCHCQVSFFVWSLRHVHRWCWWTDLDDVYVIWRLSTQGCACLRFRWYAFPFRGSNPQKHQFWGLQAWPENITSCILLKLLYWFQPKFAQW